MCPNCGRPFGRTRLQRQVVGGRGVILVWAICSHCHHVALESWEWARSPLVQNHEKQSE